MLATPDVGFEVCYRYVRFMVQGLEFWIQCLRLWCRIQGTGFRV
jgi:hypothetical protein